MRAIIPSVRSGIRLSTRRRALETHTSSEMRRRSHNTTNWKAWPWLFPAIIALVGLLPLTWFRGSVIASMDYPFPLAEPQALLQEALSTWGDGIGLGAASPTFRLLSFALVHVALANIGLPSIWRESLILVCWFMGAGLSAYFLIRVLVPDRPLAALLGGLFYMLNPFSMVVRWHELNLWLAFYAWAPLMLGSFAATLRTRRLRYLLAFLLASLLVTPAHGNVGSAALLALILGGYLAIHLWQARGEPREIRRALCASAILAVLWIGISLWWIAPTLSSLGQEVHLQQLPQETTLDRVSFSSRRSTMGRVLRLQGYWAFDLTHGGTPDPIFPYAQAYTGVFDILGWLIPLFGAIGLWKARRHRELLWPGILWLGGSFFMKGLQPPFGDFTRWLYETLPLPMSLFRHPFERFGMLTVLGLAPLVGTGMDTLGDLVHLLPRCRTHGRRALRLCLVGLAASALFVALVWPFWTGDVIYGGGDVMPSFRVSVPAEYKQARSWLEGQAHDEFRILPLPLNRAFWTSALYTWYAGYPPCRWLLGQPVMAPSMYRGSELVEPVVTRFLAAPDADLGRVLGMLNVKYVLVRDDVNWTRLAAEEMNHLSLPPDQLHEAVIHSEWLELEAQFGALRFYRNQAWQPMAAYATSTGIQVGAEYSSYHALQTAATPPGNRVVFGTADADRLGLVGGPFQHGATALSYTILTSRPWLVQMQVESEGPFFVALSQSFDQGWRLYYGAPNWLQILLGLRQFEERHFLANGYANGWYISEAGRQILTLYYWPQTLLYAGIVGTFIALVLVSLAAIFRHRVRRMISCLVEALYSHVQRALRFVLQTWLRPSLLIVQAQLRRLACLCSGRPIVRHFPVILILTLHVSLGLTYSLTIPLGEAYDEWAHFAYIRHIVTEGRLPESGQRLVPEVLYDQTHQAPVYYLLGALVTSGIDMSDNLRPAPNVHVQSNGGGQNMFVHSTPGDWPYRGSVLGFRIVRLLSVLMSTIAILAGYLTALELLPGRRPLAMAALAFTAFMPQLVFMGSVVSNDIAVTMFTTLTTLFLVRIAVRGCSSQRLVLLYASVAAAVLSKTNALGTLPAAVIVVVLCLARRDAKSYRLRMLGTALLLAMGVIALLLGWELRNLHLHYHPGSIIGLVNRVIAPTLRGESGPSAVTLYWDVLGYAPEYAFRTFWGAFGWGNIPLDGWLYFALGALTVLSVIGTVLYFTRHRADIKFQGWLALALVAALIVLMPVGFLLVTGDLYATSAGRYLLPLAPTVGIILAVGLAELVPYRARKIVLLVCTLAMLALAVVVPFRYIRPVYAKTPLIAVDELARADHPVGYRFGEGLELVAYNMRPPNPRPGDMVTISLFWRSLAEVENDYSVIVQTLDPDYHYYGGVTTNLGFPLFPTSLWRPGDVVQQTHSFYLGTTFPSQAFARVKVAVFTANDGQRVPVTSPSNGFIGEQATIGRHRVHSFRRISRVSEASTVSFGDAIRLRGYELPAEIVGGEVFSIHLLWESVRPVSHDYTVFVHLVDDGRNIVAQADSQPVGGRYPTTLWTPGEIVWDALELQVPADLQPGRYRLLAGLYRLETLGRLPAADALGHSLPANQLLLGIVSARR